MAETQRPAEAAGTFAIGGDLNVRQLGFGAMRITGPGVWGQPKDKDEAIRVLKRALELGINLIDTADSYGPEVSESLIAEALYPYPQNLVIATKGGLTRSGPDQWSPDGRPEHLREALDGSLKRLRLERIDLYQFHRPDPNVPFEDSVGALEELRKQGKIRYIGLSNVGLKQLEAAQRITRVVTVQNHYNMVERASRDMSVEESERMVDVCAEQGIGFIPWYPLAAGKGAQGASGPVTEIAKRHNAQPGQIALAWLLRRSTTMLPIPGTSSVQHLEENVQGAAIQLSQEEFDQLSQSMGAAAGSR